MDSTKTKTYHERLAKSIMKLEIEINILGDQKKINKVKWRKLSLLILSAKSEGDNLIAQTNPLIKDNIKWYYGKFRKDL